MATFFVVAAVLLGLAAGDYVAAGVNATGLVALAMAWVIVARLPASPVGPALAWCSGALGVVLSVDAVAAGAFGDYPAARAHVVDDAIWPINLAGLLALLLVFPDGRLRGRPWNFVPWVFTLGGVLILSGLWGGEEPAGAAIVGVLLGLALVGLSMMLAIASVFIRYRRGSHLERMQLRWLLLAGALVVVLLVIGWALEARGASLVVAYAPFLMGIAVLVPLSVGVAVVRHDLFDIDRILSDGAAWFLTLLASAATFGASVFAVGHVVQRHTAISSTAAAFVTALILLPTHRFVSERIARVVDRDRHVAVAQVERFAAQVRAGQRQPEEIESALREAQGDPALRLVLADGQGWVDLSGQAVDLPGGVVLENGGDSVARLVLSHDSARSRRRAAALIQAGWVSIEVSRLRLGLRQSQTRLAEASAAERRRLERDLHDGAQQRIVAIGMRLRSLQRGLGPRQASEVDTAVTELEETVKELRRLARGVRPTRLDDGLGPALEQLKRSSPVPLDLAVGELGAIDDFRTLTAYLIASEAVANALKHAQASRIRVSVERMGDLLAVQVVDDGVGGVPSHGSLTALRDRVSSIGGRITVESPARMGTTITAVL